MLGEEVTVITTLALETLRSEGDDLQLPVVLATVTMEASSLYLHNSCVNTQNTQGTLLCKLPTIIHSAGTHQTPVISATTQLFVCLAHVADS